MQDLVKREQANIYIAERFLNLRSSVSGSKKGQKGKKGKASQPSQKDQLKLFDDMVDQNYSRTDPMALKQM